MLHMKEITLFRSRLLVALQTQLFERCTLRMAGFNAKILAVQYDANHLSQEMQKQADLSL
jgi:hypothetical protein